MSLLICCVDTLVHVLMGLYVLVYLQETGRASPDTVSTITASTQYTDATTAIHSQILVDMDREKYVSRDSDSPKRSQTTRVYSAPSTRHGTPAKHQVIAA